MSSHRDIIYSVFRIRVQSNEEQVNEVITKCYTVQFLNQLAEL